MKFRIKTLKAHFDEVEAGSLQEAGKRAKVWVDAQNKRRGEAPQIILCEVRPILFKVNDLNNPDGNDAA